MATNKAPSAGTKVDLGQNAPVTREPAGKVPAGSLAAESVQQSGEFAQNRGAAPEADFTKSSFEPVNKQQGSTASSYASAAENAPRQSGDPAVDQRIPSASHKPEIPGNATTAPTYSINQYIRDPNGPHGQNIHEVETFEGEGKLKDGIQQAFNAEPGSQMDPSRRAELDMEYKGNTTAQKGKSLGMDSEGTTYEVLGADKQA